jgi:hypothetical protein
MELTYAKIMQNRMVKSVAIISGGYVLIGIVTKGYCGINAIKTGESISHLPGLYSVGDFLKGSAINVEEKFQILFVYLTVLGVVKC